MLQTPISPVRRSSHVRAETMATSTSVPRPVRAPDRAEQFSAAQLLFCINKDKNCCNKHKLVITKSCRKVMPDS